MVRILVVDDLEALLEVVKYILESNEGFYVDTAKSVEEALSLLKTHEYDIIISDYYMPEVNGLEFLKQIRSTNCDIPFIIQTGQGDEVNAIEALQNGADYFLEKGSEGTLQYLAFTQIINLLISKHRTEERLKKSEVKNKNLLELNSDGIVYVNKEGLIQEVNRPFIEITGCSEDEVKDMSFFDLIPEEWSDTDTRGLFEQVFTDGTSEEYRRDFIRCDGQRVPISIKALLFKSQKGEPEGMWIIVQDLSLKRSEQSETYPVM
ncbi:MAG: response regulator [Methanobacteriota archaeon]